MLDKLARWLGKETPAVRGLASPVVRPASDRRLPPMPDAVKQAAQQATLERLRSPMRERDLSLSLDARLWLLRLPSAVQPHALCREHPRVANRLAAEWFDTLGSEALFDDLLHDRRGGRKGFSAAVQRELRRLRHFSVRYRYLIEARRPAVDGAGGPPTLPADLDPADGIDWTPTETIVVRARP